VLLGARLNAPSTELAAFAETRPPLPTPGAGPVVERRTPAAVDEKAPEPRHTPPRRAQPPGVVPEEEYPESYGEPVSGSLSSPVVEAPVAPAGPAEWERLAEAADFPGAKAAVEREGGFGQALGRASASQLMVLADIARAVGSREQAMRALRRVLSAYDSTPEAPIAAWTLGNLLEQAGDRLGAADAYATYRRLSPAGDFAEDAAARQVDAALAQGNLELAGRAVDEYAQNFPKGKRLAELRRRLLALSAPEDASAASRTEPEEDEDASEPGADAPASPPVPRHAH
jgi:hypothetical protein